MIEKVQVLERAQVVGAKTIKEGHLLVSLSQSNSPMQIGLDKQGRAVATTKVEHLEIDPSTGHLTLHG